MINILLKQISPKVEMTDKSGNSRSIRSLNTKNTAGLLMPRNDTTDLT